jgi:hypothetical protein
VHYNPLGAERRNVVALSRKFIDSDGMHWQVYELSDDGPSSELQSGGWLYFFSRNATRSLAAYPADWALMDWPGLERLCRRARPPARRDVGRARDAGSTSDAGNTSTVVGQGAEF